MRRLPALRPMLVVLVLVGGILWGLWWALHRPDITVIECLGAALLAAGMLHVLLIAFLCRRSADDLRRRRRLLAARKYFQRELRKPSPRARRCLASLSTRTRARARRGSLVQGERHRRDRLHFIRLFRRRLDRSHLRARHIGVDRRRRTGWWRRRVGTLGQRRQYARGGRVGAFVGRKLVKQWSSAVAVAVVAAPAAVVAVAGSVKTYLKVLAALVSVAVLWLGYRMFSSLRDDGYDYETLTITGGVHLGDVRRGTGPHRPICGSKKTFVVKESDGGDGSAALAIGILIHRHNWDVEVVGVCPSACANWIFPAGKTKYLNSQSMLLFHGGPHQANMLEMAKIDREAVASNDGAPSIRWSLAKKTRKASLAWNPIRSPADEEVLEFLSINKVCRSRKNSRVQKQVRSVLPGVRHQPIVARVWPDRCL